MKRFLNTCQFCGATKTHEAESGLWIAYKCGTNQHKGQAARDLQGSKCIEQERRKLTAELDDLRKQLEAQKRVAHAVERTLCKITDKQTGRDAIEEIRLWSLEIGKRGSE